MPSLPTSLIVVGLVAAWLVVLVPMVARRREHVPDSDDDSAGFRVLRRASRSVRRRRPVMSRTAVAQDADGREFDEDAIDEIDGEMEDAAASDERWGPDDAGSDDWAADQADAEDGDEMDADDRDEDRWVADDRDSERWAADDEVGGPAAATGWDERGEGDEAVEFAPDPDGPDETMGADSPVADRRSGPGERILRRSPERGGRYPSARPRRAPVAAYRRPVRDDADDATDSRHRRGADRSDERRAAARYSDAGDVDYTDAADADYSDAGYSDGGYSDEGRSRAGYAGTNRRQDEARLRPVPVRPGRGGFDPRAAEQAKAYRYQQRRRVAMVLLALAVVCAVAGVLGVSLAWAGAACSFVLLALYLAYLRRQVRIEEAIRLRRATRLERARQIRPVYRASVAEQVRAHRSGSLPRPGPAVHDDEADAPYRVTSHARPASSVPPAYYTRGVPVDLDDDDPAFDDLEYYRPATYRRAVGE